MLTCVAENPRADVTVHAFGRCELDEAPAFASARPFLSAVRTRFVFRWRVPTIDAMLCRAALRPNGDGGIRPDSGVVARAHRHP